MIKRFSSLKNMLRDARLEWARQLQGPDAATQNSFLRVVLQLVLPIAIWLGATAALEAWTDHVEIDRVLWVFFGFFSLPFLVIAITSIIVYILVPVFSGKRNFAKAWLLMSYALAPSLIFFGLSHLIASVFIFLGGIVTFIFAFFLGIGLAAYILWDGLALLFQVPERRLGWLLVLITIFCSFAIIGLFFTANALLLEGATTL